MAHPRIVITVAVLGLLAGCSDDIDGGRTATESMVLETCAPTADPLEVEVCRCAFETVAQDYDADELERLDRRLRDEPEQIPPEVQEAILDCTVAVLEPPAPTTSTTTSTSTTVPEQDEG